MNSIKSDSKVKSGSLEFLFRGLNSRIGLAVVAAGFLSGFLLGCNSAIRGFMYQILDEILKPEHGGRSLIEDFQNKSLVLLFINGFAVLFGGFASGIIADRLGRKNSLLCSATLAILAVVLDGCAKSFGIYEPLIAGRILMGLNSGLNAGLAPMYLVEISPVQHRGKIATTYVLGFLISVFIVQLIAKNLYQTPYLVTAVLVLTIIPAISQIIILYSFPESPKYLMLNLKKEDKARTALYWFRSSTSEVEEEMEELQAESLTMKRVTFTDMFSNALLRRPLLISSFLLMSRQFIEIILILMYSYSESIFQRVGLAPSASEYIIPLLNICSSFVSLVLIDRIGRRPLILLSFIGMFAYNIVLQIFLEFNMRWEGYISALIVIELLMMYGIGLGSICWFFAAEISSHDGRGWTTSIAMGLNSISDLIVGFFTFHIMHMLGKSIFLVFAVFFAVCATLTHFYLPETRNKTTRQINDAFKH